MARGPGKSSASRRRDEPESYSGDSPPPPYAEFDSDSNSRYDSDQQATDENEDEDDDNDDRANHDFDDSDISENSDNVSLAPLGLLNGRYDITSSYVTDEWPIYGSDFELVLTLAGNSLWGKFNLGIIEGVMYFDSRPYKSSSDSVAFTWRG